MQTIETLLEREFMKLIDERIQAVKDNMGLGLMKIEEYRFAAGEISGMMAAKDVLAAAHDKSEQRNR